MVFSGDFLWVSMYVAQLKECDAAIRSDLWNKKWMIFHLFDPEKFPTSNSFNFFVYVFVRILLIRDGGLMRQGPW